jgi:hypothetical protein
MSDLDPSEEPLVAPRSQLAEPKEYVSPDFNAEDADFAIKCYVMIQHRYDPFPVRKSPSQLCVFKAHRTKLAAAPTFFHDMFESLTEEGDNKPAPEVTVTESPAVSKILVASVYNEQKHFDLSQVTTDWQLILDVYEAQ